MPRGSKRTTPVTTNQDSVATADSSDQGDSMSAEAGVADFPVATANPLPPDEPTTTEHTVAELRGATREIQDRSEAAGVEPPQRERFRSWVTDNAHGYVRWSDNEYQRIVLQFNEKPSAEILAAVKDAGFHFQPDYCGLKNAWVRRNDYTGRVSVDGIEKLIRAQSVGAESPAL